MPCKVAEFLARLQNLVGTPKGLVRPLQNWGHKSVPPSRKGRVVSLPTLGKLTSHLSLPYLKARLLTPSSIKASVFFPS